MQILVQQTYPRKYSASVQQASIWTRFIDWCTKQQEARLLWLGGALTSHACFLTPLTMVVVMFTGLNMVFLALTIAAMGICLVVNLAALPTRVTIPVFLASIVVDVSIIIAAVTSTLIR